MMWRIVRYYQNGDVDTSGYLYVEPSDAVVIARGLFETGAHYVKVEVVNDKEEVYESFC